LRPTKIEIVLTYSGPLSQAWREGRARGRGRGVKTNLQTLGINGGVSDKRNHSQGVEKYSRKNTLGPFSDKTGG